MVVFSSFAPGREQEFNDWYDRVHVPEVLSVGPIVSCQRFKISDAQAMPQTHRYVALYEFVGSAKEAVDALMGATMQMSDTLADPFMSIVESFRPKVQKVRPTARAKSKATKPAPKPKARAKARSKAKPKSRSKRK
jgi:hypothetical protein